MGQIAEMSEVGIEGYVIVENGHNGHTYIKMAYVSSRGEKIFFSTWTAQGPLTPSDVVEIVMSKTGVSVPETLVKKL